eukprot:1577642-Rhodomonas_salina.1
MDDQIHRSSLMTNADSRILAEGTDDLIWEKMKVEIVENSVGSRIPPSLLTPVMECRFLPPLRPRLYRLVPVSMGSRTFRLQLRADSRLQCRESYQQPGTAPAALDQHTDEDKQDDILERDE